MPRTYALGQSPLGLLIEALLCDDHGVSEEAFIRLSNLVDGTGDIDCVERENLQLALALTDATDGRFYLSERE